MSSYDDTIDRWATQFTISSPALVVGSRRYGARPDRRRLYQSALGVDLTPGDCVDLVYDLEKPLPSGIGLFSHLDCVSVLEHVKNPFKFSESVLTSLVPGATILIGVPFVWRIHSYPNDYWRFTPEAIRLLFPSVKWLDWTYIHERQWSKKLTKYTDEKGCRFFGRTELAMFGFV